MPPALARLPIALSKMPLGKHLDKGMCTHVGDDDVARCLPLQRSNSGTARPKRHLCGSGWRSCRDGGRWMDVPRDDTAQRENNVYTPPSGTALPFTGLSKLCVIGTFVRCTLSISAWEGHVHHPFVYAPSPSQDSGVWASTELQRELLEFLPSLSIVPDLINWNSETPTTYCRAL
jgi:hypothetical protein